MASGTTKSYSLNFKGYWREKNKEGVPSRSGIYLVYRCVYEKESNTVGLREIIYIGQAVNVRERIANHDRLGDFEKNYRKARSCAIQSQTLNLPIWI